LEQIEKEIEELRLLEAELYKKFKDVNLQLQIKMEEYMQFLKGGR